MAKLYTGYEIPDMAWGSPIVLTYMYGDTIPVGRTLRYWKHTLLRNHGQLKKDLSMYKVLKNLKQCGCHMIDTSSAYGGSEFCIGRAYRNCKESRPAIMTKLCNQDQYSHNVRKAFENSLKKMNLEYIDIYLMHWPVPEHFIDNWHEMEKLYEEGLCKAIGVCNFGIQHLEELSSHAHIKPMINQFECHPLFTQESLREYCHTNCIVPMAYTPTARMDSRFANTRLFEIADKHKKTVAQVILKWHLQIGNVPVVSTTNMKHLHENFDVFDFELSDSEIQIISNININSRLRYDPDNCDFRKL